MLVFRTFLYIICLACFVWGLFLYTGPIAIKWFITSYSADKIRAFDITVSPKLDIKIGRLEYSGQDSDGQSVRKGFSRSVNFSWSLSSGQPFIEATFGPTFFEALLSVDSLTVSTPSFSDINFKEISWKAKVANMEIDSFGDAKTLTFQGIYQRDLNAVTKLSVESPYLNLNLMNSFDLKGFDAKIDKILLNIPANNQELKINFSAAELKNEDKGINFSNLLGVVSLADTEIDFDLNFSGLELLKLGASFGKLNATGVHFRDGISSRTRIELSRAQTESVLYDRPILSINVSNLENGELSVDALGDLDPFQIVLADNYIGTLPASGFKMNMRVNSRDPQVNVTSQIELNKAGNPKINGFVGLNAKLGKTQKLLDCFDLECKILAFDGRYNFNFGQELVSGIVECVSLPCSLLTLSHSLTTTNTIEIFNMINKGKFFNPIYSIYLYGLVSAGTKLQNGHVVKIN
jgi:hypothetical protein